MGDQLKNVSNEILHLAQLAVDFDSQNQLEPALFYYLETCKLLEKASSLDLKDLGCKIGEYKKRAQEIEIKLKSLALKSLPSRNEQVSKLHRAEFLMKEALDEDEQKNCQEALDLYAEAIELCLKAKDETADDILKKKLGELAVKALERAETLKLEVKQLTQKGDQKQCHDNLSDGIYKMKLEPTSSQVQCESIDESTSATISQSGHVVSGQSFYSKEEIAVLKRTSVINGREYVPFLNVDLREKFSYQIPFSDPDGLLVLAPKQKSNFVKWLRLDEISENPKIICDVDCFRIKQTIVSDCSFVASLAVSALYEKRFKTRIITSIIYPQNKNGEPVFNPCGKYMIKLNINGIKRKIVIDDFLPTGYGRELICSYSSNSNEFWVSLLEKAYMKVMGGYDFPGSNSNIDLHALTSWIPERVSIRDSNRDKLFNMLTERYNKGDVLVTFATGELSEADCERTGLVKTHAYAMLDVRQVHSKKLFLLKNPWSHMRWKGNFSERDIINWTAEMKRTLNYDPNSAKNFDNGVFWIDIDSLFTFFDVMYMNWNPSMFKYTYCTHATWHAGVGPAKDLYNISENPQYSLTLKNPDSTVWILLTRHIVDRPYSQSFWLFLTGWAHSQHVYMLNNLKQVTRLRFIKWIISNLNDFAYNQEYIALLVYKNSGEKVYLPFDPPPFIDGVRINSPHYLCKIIPRDGCAKFTLVISQYEKSNTINYTIRAYATCPFSLKKLENIYKYKEKEMNGQWTVETAGGCQNHPESYSKNPVYQVNVLGTNEQENELLIELKGPKKYAVGIDVITITLTNQKSATQIHKFSSGSFRSGYTILKLRNLPSGIYNIVPSTFKPNEVGPFFLIVNATCPIKLSKLR